jgi:hypothetical protein
VVVGTPGRAGKDQRLWVWLVHRIDELGASANECAFDDGQFFLNHIGGCISDACGFIAHPVLLWPQTRDSVGSIVGSKVSVRRTTGGNRHAYAIDDASPLAFFSSSPRE